MRQRRVRTVAVQASGASPACIASSSARFVASGVACSFPQMS
jgi:hypothetical protein